MSIQSIKACTWIADAPDNGHRVMASFEDQKRAAPKFFVVKGGTIAQAAQAAAEQLFATHPDMLKVRTTVFTSNRQQIAKLLVKQERRLVVCGMRGGDL